MNHMDRYRLCSQQIFLVVREKHEFINDITDGSGQIFAHWVNKHNYFSSGSDAFILSYMCFAASNISFQNVGREESLQTLSLVCLEQE